VADYTENPAKSNHAKHVCIDNSYFSRMAYQAYFASDIVPAILDDGLPDHTRLLTLR